MKRNCHIIKGNEKTASPSMIITYDTETKNTQNKDGSKTHSLKLIVARFWRNNHNTITQEEKVFFDNQDFWQWVDSKIPNKQRLYLFAHNHQFDGQIANMFIELPKLQWKLKKEIIDSNIFILKWQKGINTKTKIENGKRTTIIKGNIKSIYCLDTFNYFKTSIKELGKKLGIPKLEIDFDKLENGTPRPLPKDDIELQTYCKRDVEITEKMILEFLKFIKDNDLGNFQPTIASQAFGSFRHKFMKDNIMIHTNQNAIDLERASYKGGRNEAFFIGELKQKIYCLDFNSLYPSVMIDNNFPTKLLKFKTFNNIDSLIRDMDSYLVIAELKINIDTPIMGLRKDRLIFPIGTFKGVFCGPEIQVLLDRNCVLDVGNVALYKGHKIFHDYVDFFYNKRLEAKKNKDKINDEMYKIMLNSLYGKFGQLKKDNSALKDEYGNEIEVDINENYSKGIINHVTKEKYNVKVFSGKIWKSVSTKDESFNSFPAIASYCTAYARMELLEAIETAGWSHVFYCDTDSVFVDQVGFDALQKYIDQSKLGMLKLEYVTNGMTIKGCKDYIVWKDNDDMTVKEVKIKGVPRKNTLVSEDWNSSNVYDTIRFEKFATSLHKGKIDCITEKPMQKVLKREYVKGTTLNTGFIRPLELNEE